MSTTPDSPTTSRLGGVSTGFWLVLLALSVLVFGLNTGVATWQGSRLAGAGTGAADLQVLSQQLANQGRDAVSGNAEAFKDFRQTKAQIESTVSDLQGRFGAEPGVPATTTCCNALNTCEAGAPPAVIARTTSLS